MSSNISNGKGGCGNHQDSALSGAFSSRKRSRWGQSASVPPSTSSPAFDNVPVPSSGSNSNSMVRISDDQALQALRAAAAERDQQKREEAQSLRKQQGGNRQQRHKKFKNDNNNNERRRDEKGHDSYKRNRDMNSGSHRKVIYGAGASDDYYGPATATVCGKEHKNQNNKDDDDQDVKKNKELPNFGLSGALALKDTKHTACVIYKGVKLKFHEPPEARAPNTPWRLYVFKGEEQIQILHISKQSAYLFGRHADICDVVLHHESCSSQHAVLQFRALPRKEDQKVVCQPYIMDLESTNGTFLNGIRLDDARYYALKKGDVLKFGASTREYVLLTANTTSIDS